MSKRGAEFQGGEERYGAYSQQPAAMNGNVPQRATAAQLANRKIASAKSSSRSARSSRANTPTANPFGGGSVQNLNPSQTMSFNPGSNDFTFSAGPGAPSAPMFGQNGASATPPPTMFGAANLQPSQSNGTSNVFGGGGSTFGGSVFGGSSTAQQPQSNGFAASSNLFGQNKSETASGASLFSNFGQTQNSNNASTSFGGFGQTPKTGASNAFAGFGQTQTQPNGEAASSNNNSFGSTNAQSQQPAQTSFTGFGASQQPSQSTPSTSFGGFGQSQPNGGSSLFGANKPTETPKTTGDLFKGFTSQSQAQPNGEKPSNLFGSTAASAPTPQPPTTSSLFNQPNGTKTGLFGSTPPPTSAAPNLGNSILSGLSENRASEVKTGMFTQSSSTPKPTGASLFQPSQPSAPSSEAPVDQTPKPNNIFGGFTPAQTNGAKPSLFASTADQQTPKPAASLFKFDNTAGQQAQPSSATPGFTPSMFGTSKPDASQQPKPSLFSPSTSSPFTPSAKPAQDTPSTVTQGKSLFDRIGQSDNANTTQPPTPAQNMWGRPAETASTPAAQPISTPATVAQTPAAARSTTGRSSTAEALSQSEKNTFKALNEGLKAHLLQQDPSVDWSTIFQYYLEQAAKIRNQPAPTFDLSASKSSSSDSISSFNRPSFQAGGNSLAQQLASARAPQSANATQSSTTQNSLFANSRPSDGATPMKQAKPTNLFEPPNTAPINSRKRSADDEALQPPATEKRARPNDSKQYAPLPNQASNASKLFQSLYDGSGTTGTTKSSTSKTSEANAPASGFKPTGFTPSTTTSGMPSFSAPSSGGGNFLAAFGKKASAQEESDKKKRKAEDYDSDEDNEAEWEAKDKEEQEAKKKKLMEAAKNAKGFMFASASDESKTPKPTGASLFDLSTSKASQDADKTQGEKEQGSGDHTWLPNTPIKFGGTSSATQSFTPATAPPKNATFGNLFGATVTGDKAAASTNSTSGLLSVPGAKPSLNFNFGGTPSLGTSRATTPGVTTDGEGTSTAGEGEEDVAPPEKQVEDQTELREEEKEHEDLLFSLPIAKAQKYVDNLKSKDGAPGWAERGKGPLYILKHRETGKTRIILKKPPFGKPAMNFEPMANFSYDLAGAKAVKGPFFDHLDNVDVESGKVSTWLIQVGKPEDAKEIARVLNEGRKK